MALTDFDAHPSITAPAAPRAARGPAALALLPRLHAEASANLELGRFLASSPRASIAVMLSGAAMLLATGLAGGGTLKADFTWAVLVLIGVIAMTRNYIRGFARSLRRIPLEEAASDLRILLLYTGAAWGTGSFLVMPDAPMPFLTVAFALLPGVALAAIVKDRKGGAFFLLAAAAATAAAAILGAWPQDLAVAGVICAAVVVALGLPALQHKNRTPAPPKLALL